MEKVEKTTNVITEKPIWVHVGFFWFLLRPLTMAQIWELGSYLSNVEGIEIRNKNNTVIAETLAHHKAMESLAGMMKILLFRGKVKRWLFGRYIKNHITMAEYKKIMEFSFISMQASFFLTSFTFLGGIRTITSPTSTNDPTALGDSLEE